MDRKLLILSSLILSMSASPLFAAKSVNLNFEKTSAFLPLLNNEVSQKDVFKETRREWDAKIQKLHIHYQQFFLGHKVFGGESILHISKTNQLHLAAKTALKDKSKKIQATGVFYQNLSQDLLPLPSDNHLKQAIQQVRVDYSKKAKIFFNSLPEEHDLIVYVDKNDKAHWAYQIKFEINEKNKMPAKPVYIIDAYQYNVYQQWNDIKTFDCASSGHVCGGGFGGNTFRGKFSYDGLTGPLHLTKLAMQRDDATKICSLKNNVAQIVKYSDNQLMSFKCDAVDANHNNVYWDSEFDNTNEGYSPANDALYAMTTTSDMFSEWLGVPLWADSQGTPLTASASVHFPYDEAFWSGSSVILGDGGKFRYPYTTLDIVAHEASHGFTQQHSDLIPFKQSGAISESFSDATGVVVNYYATGTPSWEVGLGSIRDGGVLRYMDQPSKDCYGETPGNYCSIDDATQYVDGLDVHYASGVFNRFYYLLSNTADWNPRLAFEVLAKANQSYWTSTETFKTAACGIISASLDLCNNEQAIVKAFSAVGIDTSDCAALKE